MFYSESAGEMWNHHINVPKIAPELLFPISGMNCSDKMFLFSLIKSIYLKLLQICNHVKVHIF